MDAGLTIDFPLQICILDIETDEDAVRNPEGCVVFVVGVKTFVLREGSYQAAQYKWYSPKEFADLAGFLHSFNGLIIGHNIFEFDYRTIRLSLSLDGVLEKTVDTLDFLRRKIKKRRKGLLSLDSLSRANLGKSKTLDGESAPKLWRQGRYDEVIAYNENDCLLTMELWQHFVIERSGVLKSYQKTGWTDEGTFNISDKDLEELLGKKPKYTYETWKQKLEAGEFNRQKRRQSKEWDIAAMEAEPDFATSYCWYYCKASNQTFLFKQRRLPGARRERDLVKIECPGCANESIPVGEVHKLLGSVQGDVGGGNKPVGFPEQFEALMGEHMKDAYADWIVFKDLIAQENPVGEGIHEEAHIQLWTIYDQMALYLMDDL
jgi:hypothetical protein